MYVRTCLLVSLLFVLLAAAPHRDSKQDAQIERLVAKLGSEDFDEREEAGERLAKLGEKAIPALLEATKSQDLEVRRRAARLLVPLQRQVEEREVARLTAEIGKVGMSEFVRLTVSDEKYATKERWLTLKRLTAAAAARASAEGKKKFEAPALEADLTVVRKKRGEKPEKSWVRSRLLLDGDTPSFTMLSGCVVLSRGSLEHVTSISKCVLFIDGDVKATSIDDCVIVCSGSVQATGIRGSVVLCLGKGLRAAALDDNFIEASGGARCNGSIDNVFLNMDRIRSTSSRGDVYFESDKGLKPLFPFDAQKKK